MPESNDKWLGEKSSELAPAPLAHSVSKTLPSPFSLLPLLPKQPVDNMEQHSPKVMDNQPTMPRALHVEPGTDEWRRNFAQFLQSQEIKAQAAAAAAERAAALAAERARFEGFQPTPPPPKPRVPPGPLILGPNFQRYAPVEVGTIVSGYALSLKSNLGP